MGIILIALATFARYWFPAVQMRIFAAGFGLLGLMIVFFGNKGFDRVEYELAGWIGAANIHLSLRLPLRHFWIITRPLEVVLSTASRISLH